MSKSEVKLMEFVQCIRSYLRMTPNLEKCSVYELCSEMESLAENGDLECDEISSIRAGAISFLIYLNSRKRT